MSYGIIRHYCNCHPESCACSRYRIICNGICIAKGSDKDAMAKLVYAANEHLAKSQGVQS